MASSPVEAFALQKSKGADEHVGAGDLRMPVVRTVLEAQFAAWPILMRRPSRPSPRAAGPPVASAESGLGTARTPGMCARLSKYQCPRSDATSRRP